MTTMKSKNIEEKTISPHKLQQLLSSQAAPVIVDVRSGLEYKNGHIPGAVHLPFWSAAFRHEKIGAFPQTPLVLTCLHGPRAKLARYFLSRASFQNIRLLDGHMVAWKRLNMPLTKKKETS
jgi:rhodanese-related sulfurtransferase